MNDSDEMEKILIRIAVEKTLLEMGTPELEKVESTLLSKYNCKLEDCLEHPEALKEILCELYGYCYDEIFESILQILSTNSTMDAPIENFINILRC